MKTFTATLALVAAAALSPASAEELRLQIPVAFSTALPGLGIPITRVAENLETLSGGDIRVRVYEPSALVPPFEIVEAGATGVASAGYTTAGYWAGQIPAAPLFSAVPFGPEAGEYMAWMYYGNGRELYQRMYDEAGFNVHVVPCAIIAPETSGWFATEINSPEDLQGLRMRFFGLGGRVMERLGVATSLLPGGEIFPALENGVIDATEFSMPAIDQRLGFHRVVSYNYFPGWHQQATIFELLINGDVWEGATEQQQAIIEAVCLASMTDSFAEGEASQFDAMIANVEENGVHIRQWSPEMLDLFRTTWDEVADEMVEADPFFAEVWEDLSTFRSQYDLWEENAFLPRGG